MVTRPTRASAPATSPAIVSTPCFASRHPKPRAAPLAIPAGDQSPPPSPQGDVPAPASDLPGTAASASCRNHGPYLRLDAGPRLQTWATTQLAFVAQPARQTLLTQCRPADTESAHHSRCCPALMPQPVNPLAPLHADEQARHSRTRHCSASSDCRSTCWCHNSLPHAPQFCEVALAGPTDAAARRGACRAADAVAADLAHIAVGVGDAARHTDVVLAVLPAGTTEAIAAGLARGRRRSKRTPGSRCTPMQPVGHCNTIRTASYCALSSALAPQLLPQAPQFRRSHCRSDADAAARRRARRAADAVAADLGEDHSWRLWPAGHADGTHAVLTGDATEAGTAGDCRGSS